MHGAAAAAHALAWYTRATHTPCRARPVARMEALEKGCQLDVLLLYEVVLDDVMEVMFPVNTLRNLALLQVGWELGVGVGSGVCVRVCVCVHAWGGSDGACGYRAAARHAVGRLHLAGYGRARTRQGHEHAPVHAHTSSRSNVRVRCSTLVCCGECSR